MNYYKRHLGDYAKDTKRLTIYEHGVYNVLLDEYYSQETPLTDQDIEELIQPNGQKEKNSVEKVLKRYFKRDGNFWRHSYADRVIEAAQAKSQKAAESASKRWEKSKDESKIKCERNANAYETHCESECVGNASHKPIANSHKPLDTTVPNGTSVSNSKTLTSSLRSDVCAEPKNGSPPPENVVITIPLVNGDEFPITDSQLEEFEKLYPGIDVMQTLRDIRGWNLTNKANRKTKSGIMRHVNGWLAKEQDRSKPMPMARGSPYRPTRDERNQRAIEEAKVLIFGNDDERKRLREL